MINFVMQQNSLDSGILLTMNGMLRFACWGTLGGVGSTIVVAVLGLVSKTALYPAPLSERARVFLCAYLY